MTLSTDTLDLGNLHVFSNGTDTIFGASASEALRMYCQEIGEAFDDYPGGVEGFKQVPDDKPITVHGIDHGPETQTMTAREWIAYSVNETGDLNGSRLICSTEY